MTTQRKNSNTVDLDQVSINIGRTTPNNSNNEKSLINKYYDPTDSFYQKFDPLMTEKLNNWYQNPEQAHKFITNDRFKQIESSLKQHLQALFTNEFPTVITYEVDIAKVRGELMESLSLTTQCLEFGLCVEWIYQQSSDISSELDTGYQVTSSTESTCPNYPPDFTKPVFEPCHYPHLLKFYILGSREN